jgi:hypothetical protein
MEQLIKIGMNMKYIFEFGLIGFLIGSVSAQSMADTCPPPPNSIAPSLSATVTFDKKSQLYNYQYIVKNGPNARIPLDFLGLLLNQAPLSVRSAPYWSGDLSIRGFAPSEFIWSTFAIKASDANTVTGDGTLSPPLYAIQPGKSLTGFEFSSLQGPSVTQFSSSGFTQAAASTPSIANDEPTPSCPEWDFQNSQLQVYVSGMTVGPSDPSTVSVKIRAREETGLHSCAPINPKSPSGKIAVLVLSTSTFDASQINASSVIFGPSYAAPISSKIVKRGIGEKIGADESADWEKVLEKLNPKSADKKKVSFENFLLTFDIASLDVQCNLDQALFLRGKTNSGQQFVGAVPAKVVGCGSQEIGKHKRHKLPYKWWISQATH